MGCCSWVQIWPKFYHCKRCTACTIVSYITAIYQQSIVTGHATWWRVLALLSWYPLIIVKSLLLNWRSAPVDEIYMCPIFKWVAVTWLNSLRPSDAIWRHRSMSTSAQVMAWCLMAPSHYLNQCWLMISGVLWHSPDSNLTEDIHRWNDFEIY